LLRGGFRGFGLEVWRGWEGLKCLGGKGGSDMFND
jgi:hypothetical protein